MHARDFKFKFHGKSILNMTEDELRTSLISLLDLLDEIDEHVLSMQNSIWEKKLGFTVDSLREHMLSLGIEKVKFTPSGE